MSNDKSLVSIISSLLLLLITVSSFTYAYFTADTAGVKGLNITTSVGDKYVPVFTAYPEGNLNVVVNDADMLKPDANSSNTTVAASATQKLYVTLIAGNTTTASSCTFDLKIVDKGTTYVPSSAASSLNEYTIKVTDGSGTSVVAEKKINSLLSASTKTATLKSGLSISSKGTTTTQTYNVTVTVYNLNVSQTIYGKSYSHQVTAANVSC